ncbi:lectin [Thraustotheca clavata]|uniref:Lectin n=1 Tax=Thraustotheca clavata TaxID=74557 RepID=A0A1W0A9J5_9STRA|nr:lectin [Thraustotheca clavata]
MAMVGVQAALMEAMSFAGPFDKIDANGNRYVNGTWIHGGATEVKKGFIRLTPDRQSKKGYVWNNQVLGRQSFSAILTFRISGQGQKWFGDGIGLWITTSPNYVYGENHGFVGDFTGIGIIMDTFVNPEHKGGHKDISIQYNDGTKSLDTLNDETKIGCDAAIRYYEESASFSPVHSAARIKVRVDQNRLRVDVDATNQGSWTRCFEGEIPFSTKWLEDATIGISAATGGVADNHDILQLSTFEFPDDPAMTQVDSDTLMHNLSKDYKKWFNEPSCQTDCLIAVLTKEIENFRIESEHKLTDLKEKTGNTISKLREAEQANEDRLQQIYQKIINVVDNSLDRRVADTASQVKAKIDAKVKNAPSDGSWKIPFFILVIVLGSAGFMGYKKYQELRKSHLL